LLLFLTKYLIQSFNNGGVSLTVNEENERNVDSQTIGDVSLKLDTNLFNLERNGDAWSNFKFSL